MLPGRLVFLFLMPPQQLLFFLLWSLIPLFARECVGWLALVVRISPSSRMRFSSRCDHPFTPGTPTQDSLDQANGSAVERGFDSRSSHKPHAFRNSCPSAHKHVPQVESNRSIPPKVLTRTRFFRFGLCMKDN